MIRKATLAGALVLGMLSGGCLGPNNAHNGLRNWNAEVSDQDWVNELVFLGREIHQQGLGARAVQRETFEHRDGGAAVGDTDDQNAHDTITSPRTSPPDALRCSW